MSIIPSPTEIRPWGAFQNLFKGPNFLVKLIEVLPGQRLSLQRHFKREESWIVVSGEGLFELNGKVQSVGAGAMMQVGLEQKHRVANKGTAPLVILELQQGECSEDDIERIEDDYARK